MSSTVVVPPGSKIVLRIDDRLSRDRADYINAHMRAFFDGERPWLIIDDGIDVIIVEGAA